MIDPFLNIDINHLHSQSQSTLYNLSCRCLHRPSTFISSRSQFLQIIFHAKPSSDSFCKFKHNGSGFCSCHGGSKNHCPNYDIFSQIQKLDWKVLDFKIQTWLSGSGTVIHTLFTGERVLCDHVFEGYDSIREACFAEIAKEAAMHFLLFPELVAKSKKSPEKLFRVLDLFNLVLDLWVDIESVFSFESTGSVRSQASSTFLKLGEAARFIVSEFEMGIQKDASKNLVPGGRINPLTRYAMDYLVQLSDYEFALSEIYLDFPIQTSSPVSETLFDTSTNSSPSSYDSDSSSVPEFDSKEEAKP